MNAITNGHRPDTELDLVAIPDADATHRAGLAACSRLADKIRYACEHAPGTEVEQLRAWLAQHGVSTRNNQRPYVSTKVNAWRREHSVERVENASTDAAGPAGARGFYAVAAMSMAVSVDTSWRFFDTELGITNIWERGAMFTVLEAALIACGYGMRAGVRRSGRPGPARLWVWALCGMSAYMAVVLSGPVAGLARVALGPALGLVMLHLALGIEIRAGAHRTDTWARIGRELRERALSRLGLADDERDALARSRDRAARRVARLALAPAAPWRDWRMARALRASNIAHDTPTKALMLDELAILRHAGELKTLEQPSPWTTASSSRPTVITK